MNDEYLWNREGEPDEEVVRLERLLSPLRYRAPKPSSRKMQRRWFLAAAAAAICSVTGLYVANRGGPFTSWQTEDGRHVRTGQLIEGGTVEAPLIGRLEIDPHSRLRMVEAGQDGQRFHLEQGTIHALIWAPPGRFVVDTPSAKAIDLGCRYTLQTTKSGEGLVTVETGWVAFERGQLESFIPAGAACVTRPRLGPGTPWFTDASPALRKAVSDFDTSQGAAGLQAALNNARQRDALTLWHLMVRTRSQQRAAVFDRFAALVKLPGAASRDAVLRGDATALDAAWNALDLGSTDWWREWKRKW